jgi:hypothetical protein
MAADVGIWNALLQPPKSALDYANEFGAADDRKQTRALNALKMQEAQQGLADQAGYRSALAGAPADEEARIRSLLGSGNPLAVKHGQEMRKAQLDATNTQAQARNRNADAAKTEFEAQKAKTDYAWQAIGAASDPQAAQRLINDGVQKGHFSMQDATRLNAELQQTQGNPQAFQQWRQEKVMGLLSAHDQLSQQMKAQEFQLKNNNELIGVDGSINQPVIAAKKSIAKSGAPTTNIGINTEKTYAGNVAEGLAKNDVSALDAARSAPDRLQTARSVKAVLEGSKAITGTGADARLAITKALATAGLVNGDSTTATEDLVSMLNSQTLDAVKTSGLGAGQGFTDKDRQFLQDAKSGRIELNAKSLWRMADLNERAAQQSINHGNKIAARLKGNPAMGSVAQDLEVSAPTQADSLQQLIQREAERRAKMKGR